MPKIKSEKQFGNIFVGSPSLQQLCSSDNVYIAGELKTSLGVPDYVLLTDGDYQALERFARNYAGIRMSGKYAAVISYVAKNTYAKVEVLADLLSQKRGELLTALRELENWGVIDFDDNETQKIRLSSGFDIPLLHSIAIELKLSSWEKALWQASRNGCQFAASYVVMPSDKLDLLSSKTDLFKSNKVSTAVFDVDDLTLTPIHSDSIPGAATNRYYIEALDCLVHNLPAFEHVRFN